MGAAFKALTLPLFVSRSGNGLIVEDGSGHLATFITDLSAEHTVRAVNSASELHDALQVAVTFADRRAKHGYDTITKGQWNCFIKQARAALAKVSA